MKKIIFLISLFWMFSNGNAQNFTQSFVLPSGVSLNNPYDLVYATDNYLWVTERVARKISRINPANGIIDELIDLSSVVYRTGGQDGLLGFALHPNFGTANNNFLYVAYTYSTNGNDSGRKLRIVRLTYSKVGEDGTLFDPQTIIENLSASNDHNSGKIAIAGDKLFYTHGDQGANQFNNKCNPILSQELPTQAEITALNYTKYQGKILRMNLDGSIPTDNPIIGGVKSHIYSYGHRNPQGIFIASNGKIYANEHGPKTDDEINLIEAGKNYGWPRVAGFKDNKAYEYCPWALSSTCAALPFNEYACPTDVTPLLESDFTNPDFKEPLRAFYTVENNYDFSGGYLSWPGIAPSSLKRYENVTNPVPGWENSLFTTALKKGRVYRSKLSPDGNSIIGTEQEIFISDNRIRCLAYTPDGGTFYIITDSSGQTSGPTNGGVAVVNPGAIIKYQYTGPIPTPPTAICKNITVELDAFGVGTITAADINNNSVDTGSGGSIAFMAIDRTTFGCADVGTPQTVYLTVTDNQGSESSCNAIVTVTNTTQPLTAPTLPTITQNCSAIVLPTILNYKCLNIIPTTTDNTNFDTTGNYIINWNYTDGISSVSATQNVIISNTSPITGISTSAITTNSAQINFTDNNGIITEIRYRKVGTTDYNFATSTGNSILLSQLLANTNYEYQLRTLCNANLSNFGTLATFTTLNPLYCTATGNISSNNFITQVQFAGINKIAATASTYSDFTNEIANVNSGNSYDLIITKNANPTTTMGYSVWIDFNKNRVFEASERVAGTLGTSNLIPANQTSVTYSVIIPANALTGTTRMRIIGRSANTPNNSCGTIATGSNSAEIEDYTVNVETICGSIATTWNGSYWSNGLPTSSKEVIFTGNYSSNGIIEACKLSVTGTAIVTINTNNTLKVTGIVNVATTAQLIFENNASLVQTTATLNIGKIKFKRTSQPLVRLDYSAWSSPVSEQQLQAFSPNTLPNRFYTYDSNGTTTATSYTAANATTNFLSAKGYMIRAANNWPTTATRYNGEFFGIPNNGNYSQTVGTGFNLVGNPFPSSINAKKFLTDNPTISTLYFWTHTIPANAAGVYLANNYASYTSLGGTFAAAGGEKPNDFIQAGQGFFVKATAVTGSVVFNNLQRKFASESMQFFKNTNQNQEAQTQSDNRIWLNLNDANGLNNQILIGYTENASNDLDPTDGEIADASFSSIYSMINNLKYVIQGRSLPFSDNDIVPIGFKAQTNGNYTISIDSFDGLFENQDVYLKDNTIGNLHNLKSNPYNFTATTGEFNTRFEIVYNQLLGNNQSVFLKDQVIAFTLDTKLIIKSNNTTINKIEIYDTLGRLMYQSQKVNSNEVSISKANLGNSMLLVKTTLSNGKTSTNKVF